MDPMIFLTINSIPASSVWLSSSANLVSWSSLKVKWWHLSPGLVLDKHTGQRRASSTHLSWHQSAIPFLPPTHSPSNSLLILILGRKPSLSTSLTGIVAPRLGSASPGSLSSAYYAQLQVDGGGRGWRIVQEFLGSFPRQASGPFQGNLWSNPSSLCFSL